MCLRTYGTPLSYTTLAQREKNIIKGRFAPSPSGRMHLGNVFAALLSWLAAKSRNGAWLLRIEDLDTQRCKRDYALQIEDDLAWLGLEWDEGGTDGKGQAGPYCQSLRSDIYQEYFSRLRSLGHTYPCTCKRADILATQAPHESDGRVAYKGTCRPAEMPPFPSDHTLQHATRLYVPDEDIRFNDLVFGLQSINLSRQCGDFILRRADGAWAYQLAVVVDDALMGVNQVVRGCDLLLSAAQQIYLFTLLGFAPPQYGHVPLLCNGAGQRLSKRDSAMDMGQLRRRLSPGQIIGALACAAGLQPTPDACSADSLIQAFVPDKIRKTHEIIIQEPL